MSLSSTIVDPHISGMKKYSSFVPILCSTFINQLGRDSFWNTKISNLETSRSGKHTRFFPMCSSIVKMNLNYAPNRYSLDQLVAHRRKRRIMINLYLHSWCGRQNDLVTLFSDWGELNEHSSNTVTTVTNLLLKI